MTCNCHPNSPFRWKEHDRPSVFLQDVAFRTKGFTMEQHLNREESLVAYKQFGIFSRAHPLTKPFLNKHEQ